MSRRLYFLTGLAPVFFLERGPQPRNNMQSAKIVPNKMALSIGLAFGKEKRMIHSVGLKLRGFEWSPKSASYVMNPPLYKGEPIRD